MLLAVRCLREKETKLSDLSDPRPHGMSGDCFSALEMAKNMASAMAEKFEGQGQCQSVDHQSNSGESFHLSTAHFHMALQVMAYGHMVYAFEADFLWFGLVFLLNPLKQ